MQVVPESVIKKYLGKIPEIGDKFTIKMGTFKVTAIKGNGRVTVESA